MAASVPDAPVVSIARRPAKGRKAKVPPASEETIQLTFSGRGLDVGYHAGVLGSAVGLYRRHAMAYQP